MFPAPSLPLLPPSCCPPRSVAVLAAWPDLLIGNPNRIGRPSVEVFSYRRTLVKRVLSLGRDWMRSAARTRLTVNPSCASPTGYFAKTSSDSSQKHHAECRFMRSFTPQLGPYWRLFDTSCSDYRYYVYLRLRVESWPARLPKTAARCRPRLIFDVRPLSAVYRTQTALRPIDRHSRHLSSPNSGPDHDRV